MYGGANGLVHKSPEKQFLPNKRVRNRLMLKVDVGTAGAEAQATARATQLKRAEEAKAMRMK